LQIRYRRSRRANQEFIADLRGAADFDLETIRREGRRGTAVTGHGYGRTRIRIAKLPAASRELEDVIALSQAFDIRDRCAHRAGSLVGRARERLRTAHREEGASGIARQVDALHVLTVHDRRKRDTDPAQRVVRRIELLAPKIEQTAERAAGDVARDVDRPSLRAHRD